MTLTEEEGSQASVEQGWLASTQTNDAEAITSERPPMVMQEPPAEKLPAPMLNVLHDTFAQELEVLADLSLGENYRNERIEPVKEKWDCLLAEQNG